MNSPLNPAVLNRHGFATPERFKNYEEWRKYAIEKINFVISSQKNPIDRINISDFMKMNQFKDSRIQTGPPEPKRVVDMVDDPLPPYDFENVLFSPSQMLAASGISDDWYTKAGWPESWFNWDWSQLSLPPVIGEQMKYAKTGVKRSNEPRYIIDKMQRREWGFREKVLHGYPEYEPWFYGSGKIIMGFVTAGSGVFSGIQSTSDLKYNKFEKFRRGEMGSNRLDGEEMIPTGLCFIQDETGGIGISLGSDVRYMYHPQIYKFNFSNPSIYDDEMHMGSMMIPKADYRQFLRVGDFVIIEIGTNFKYWHSVLGMQPRYWEELYGEYDGVDFSNKETYEQHYSQPEEDQYMDLFGEKNSGWEMIYTNVPRTAEHAEYIRKRRIGKNRPPYIDGWGGHQNPATNQKVLEGFAGIDTPLKWYTHPEDMGPDSSPRGSLTHGEYAIYPVQEDHPWSTGTPIPVNSGMPYIMASDFLVDNTDRRSPAPFIMKNHEFRGIPLFDVDKYRKNDTELDPDTTWKFPGPSPNAPGGLTEWPGNAWDTMNLSENIGSKRKGMLIKLERVRFVLPPKRKQLFVKQASESEQFSTQNTLNSFVDNFINAAANDFDDYKVVLNYLNTDGTITKTASIEDIKSYSAVQEMALLSKNIDARGYKFSYDWDTTVNVLSGLNYDGSVRDIVESIVSWSSIAINIFFPGAGIALSIAFNIINNSSDLPDYDVEESGDIGRYLLYEKVETESPFPKTVDFNNGGYWWVNPNIPLTNARSHYKDYKESTAVDTLGDYADEVAIFLGLIGGLIDLSRGEGEDSLTGWTQLKSSTKISDLVKVRTVKDLGERYYNYYEPFAEEWKPYRRHFEYDPMTDSYSLKYIRNKFRPIPSGSFFEEDKIYYVVDKHNVVVPIRINANTEIARYNLPIPTGLCDITGIAWQNSLGKPGMEWERESYNMQLWPRFASDIISYNTPPMVEDDGEFESFDPEINFKQYKFVNPKETYPTKITSGDGIFRTIKTPDTIDCNMLQERLIEIQNEKSWLAGYYRGNPVYKPADFCSTLNIGEIIYIRWQGEYANGNPWDVVFEISKKSTYPLTPSFGTRKGEYERSFYSCECKQINKKGPPGKV